MVVFAQIKKSFMYKFELTAHTKPGQAVEIVGSTPDLGQWDVNKSIALHTNGDRYPMWSTEKALNFRFPLKYDQLNIIEYKYLIKDEQGNIEWENFAPNRRLLISNEMENQIITVDDGAFGYWQPYPFGYLTQTKPKITLPQQNKGLKIVVIGSSVALGYKSWLLKGWVQLLSETLAEKYGHQVVNVSESGANVGRTISRFPSLVTPEKPDLVIIALSLGNEGLAYSKPNEQKGIQRRFEAGLQQLVKMTKEIGAIPVLGGLYPHNYYSFEHYQLLKETHQRILSWGLPVLNWLDHLDDGHGHWRDDTSFDPAHPNSKGHQLMYESINLNLFNIKKKEIQQEVKKLQETRQNFIYQDSTNFEVISNLNENSIKFVNYSVYNYGITPQFEPLQTALKKQTALRPGLYLAKNFQPGILPFFELTESGIIDTYFYIPGATEVEYVSVVNWFTPPQSDVLFYDGQIGIIKENDKNFWVINETGHEYNIHPMWKQVRNSLKNMTSGVYQDLVFPDVPFRTVMIDQDGLASRFKIPPKAAVIFEYQCQLADISRVGIIPLGARCAARMVLYKLGYDGPAYPFDLTRTTDVGDVADMIAHGFADMWNRDLLCYNPEEHRIYHRRWSGLSFAHEIEDDEDPLTDLNPVFERMYTRYHARSERFWFTMRYADELLFVRNSYCDRQGIIDLVEKLKWKCEGKPFRLLIISPQDSREYAWLPNVIHYNYDFNPDRMYEDQGYWDYCTGIMGSILQDLGISSKNLFWCPPTLKWH